VLILPPGHAQAIRTPRQFGRREKVVVSVMLAMTVAVVIAVLISFTSSGHKSANGCIDFNLPQPVGGSEVYRCGAGARELCSTALKPGAYTKSAVQDITAACRKAGLPVS